MPSPTGYTVQDYIHWYPAIKQAEMRDEWLEKHEFGQWQFTGQVTAAERTVVTPQADTNYGYSWFNISNQPVVITMPAYDKFHSLSVFDMHHFMEVVVAPEKPVVVRLPHQHSPFDDAYEIVLQTYQGLAFTRQVIVDNADEVMDLASRFEITGGGGDAPFIIPDFPPEIAEAGFAIIKEYGENFVPDGTKIFGSPYEGVGDLDRAGGVFVGQLGTQARYVNYAQYVRDDRGDALSGERSYELTVPASGLLRSDKGYWSLTIYNVADRYLIPNEKGVYSINSYQAVFNDDGSATLSVNPDGDGANGIPTAGLDFYGVFRAYEPEPDLVFPEVVRVDR